MRKVRKEELLRSFPEVPFRTQYFMQDRRLIAAVNYLVFLAKDNMLFVRGFHKFVNGRIEERQRYVFAEDGCVRYGKSKDGIWSVRKEFSEPKFYYCYYGYSDNRYEILNRECVKDTCMKYSGVEYYEGNLVVSYFKYWLKHRNAEYLVKSGYSWLVESDMNGGNFDIDWKSNNLLKMLHLNRAEFKVLQGHEDEYFHLISQRDKFPGIPPEELLKYLRHFKNNYGTIDFLTRTTGLNLRQLYCYLVGQNIRTSDYEDYLRECQKLKYCLTDKEINRPKHFQDMHIRTASAVKYQHNESVRKKFAERIPERRKLEFQSGNLVICQPSEIDEITAEGKILHHCVAGYAERHAEGKLHILFIRQADKPDVPFYTMELTTGGKIIQVRGSHNCETTPEVAEFVEKYKVYLQAVFGKRKLMESAA
ncbi:MAG: PcfJ domain-containing protein [Oscillospiraceae bacterium]|nr:PcfJ domain-containing protein [Oscillospiraceae bacterium]